MFLHGETPVKMENENQKVRIAYPCRWRYKVIGADEAGMRAAIAAATDGAADVTVSRGSATGRYLSLDVAVQVGDESARIAVYEALRKDPSVKVVLQWPKTLRKKTGPWPLSASTAPSAATPARRSAA
jgi:hypothetical protein